MSFFDVFAKAAVAITDTVYSDVVSWVNGETTYTAAAKFKDTWIQEKKGDGKLGDVKYGVDNWSIEFLDSSLPGLKALIQGGNKPTLTVSVRGTPTQYAGIVANALSDGLCTEVRLRLKTGL